jgi:hypothetical protein
LEVLARRGHRLSGRDQHACGAAPFKDLCP